MKNRIRCLSVIFLTSIYCFTIGNATTSAAHSVFQDSLVASHETFISDLSTALFCNTLQSKNSVSNFNKLPTSNFKNRFAGFWVAFKATEQLFNTEFFQYTNFSSIILINHRKYDFIFPFHYFW